MSEKAWSWERLKEQPITVGTAILLLVAVGWIHAWLGLNYISRAEAEQDVENLASQIQKALDHANENTRILKSHIYNYDLNTINAAIKEVRDQQFNIQAFVSANGHSALTREREDQLKRREGRLLEYKACFQAPDCEPGEFPNAL